MAKRIGLLTSGGDAPGMNACIRAVVRSACASGKKVYGFYRGFEGLIHNRSIPMWPETVSGIIARGGTCLKTARSEAFKTPEGQEKAIQTLREHELDALIVIGGDGSFRGALDLYKKTQISVVGIPGTIDNDLQGTDYTIGFDTALNTAVEAIDRIRDTAESHDRVFIIEVMGRDSGRIALSAALAGGAEGLLLPEIHNDFESLVHSIQNWRHTKSSRIIVVGEGDENGGALHIARILQNQFTSLEFKVTILGHLQRGGKPTALERIYASTMGEFAVQQLDQFRYPVMVGIQNQKPLSVLLSEAVKVKPPLDPILYHTFLTLSQ